MATGTGTGNIASLSCDRIWEASVVQCSRPFAGLGFWIWLINRAAASSWPRHHFFLCVYQSVEVLGQEYKWWFYTRSSASRGLSLQNKCFCACVQSMFFSLLQGDTTLCVRVPQFLPRGSKVCRNAPAAASLKALWGDSEVFAIDCCEKM